jgi:hypothetical protein
MFLSLSFPQYFVVFDQVKFSLEAAKSAQTNATVGVYDASAGMLFFKLHANLKACY